MKNQHTPGPWKSTDNGIFANELNAHGNFYICSLPFVNEETSEKEKANLALISAAPDLLSALRWFADELPGIIRAHCPTGVPMSVASAHDAARAAIAKAEGNK